MNAYFIITKEEVQVSPRRYDPPEPGESDIVADIVFAETRGQAHRIFASHYNLEWLEAVSIKKIAADVDRLFSLAHYDDRYWIHVNPETWRIDLSEYQDIIREYRDYPASGIDTWTPDDAIAMIREAQQP